MAKAPSAATLWVRAALNKDPLTSNKEVAAAAVAAGHTKITPKFVGSERYRVKSRGKQREYDRQYSRRRRAMKAKAKPAPPPVTRHIERNRVRVAAHDAKIAIRTLIVQLGAAVIYDIVDELLSEATKGPTK